MCRKETYPLCHFDKQENDNFIQPFYTCLVWLYHSSSPAKIPYIRKSLERFQYNSPEVSTSPNIFKLIVYSKCWYITYVCHTKDTSLFFLFCCLLRWMYCMIFSKGGSHWTRCKSICYTFSPFAVGYNWPTQCHTIFFSFWGQNI